MPEWVAFSVDLEPNKDGSLDGIESAMSWYDETISRGTVYTTYHVATDVPHLVASLAENHEIGVHVHPREFGHDADDLAALSRDRQRDLIARTREAVADAAGLQPASLSAFRAGRHKASPVTLELLAELGFEVDASVNVRYRDYMPEAILGLREPSRLESGLVEVPTTFIEPSIFSRVGLRVFPQRTVTATATTLREDDRLCTGVEALRSVFDDSLYVSFYMHPYDATDYHGDLMNAGAFFRKRIEDLLGEFEDANDLITAGDVHRML